MDLDQLLHSILANICLGRLHLEPTHLDLRRVCEEVRVDSGGTALDKVTAEPADGAGTEARDSIGGDACVLPPPLRVRPEVLQHTT
jgi:hypothetical protein